MGLDELGQVVLVSVILTAGVSGVGLAGQPPLADAGLDQHVPVGASVRLDATGSRDPDGTISAYNWTIEATNGTVREPACENCGRTRFRPRRIGRYNVTVTVTDDDGLTRSDTLYVAVQRGSGPTVNLTGLSQPPTNAGTTYTANASAGNVALGRISWSANGSQVGSQSLTGDEQSATHEFTFTNQSTRNLTVSVVDVAGQRTNDSLVVEPRRASSGGGGVSATASTIRSPLVATVHISNSLLHGFEID